MKIDMAALFLDIPPGWKIKYLGFDWRASDNDGNSVRISPIGTRGWFRRDIRHREHGPAVEYPDGWCEWWRDGKFTECSRKQQ